MNAGNKVFLNFLGLDKFCRELGHQVLFASSLFLAFGDVKGRRFACSHDTSLNNLGMTTGSCHAANRVG